MAGARQLDIVPAPFGVTAARIRVAKWRSPGPAVSRNASDASSTVSASVSPRSAEERIV